MLICISGPASTGKTTLMRTFSSQLVGDEALIHPLISQFSKIETKAETVRSFHRSFMPDKTLDEILADPELAIKFQIGIAQDLVNQVVETAKNGKDHLTVMDRGPLDTYVYLTINYSKASPDLMERYSRDYHDMCHQLRVASELVDRYFFTVPDPNSYYIVDDGYRSKGYSYRRDYEIELFTMLGYTNPKVEFLPAETDLRVLTIYRYLMNLEI